MSELYCFGHRPLKNFQTKAKQLQNGKVMYGISYQTEARETTAETQNQVSELIFLENLVPRYIS